MQLGVFADVHGNVPAMQAVLADGTSVGVERWWALGDLVALGPEPAAMVELLRSVPNLSLLRGNTERYVLTTDRPYPSLDDVAADPSLVPLFAAVHGSFTWTRGALGADGCAWLDALPSSLELALPDGTRVLGVHASPQRDDGRGISPQRDEEELQGELADVDADVVIAGHTHRVTDRVIGRVRAVNTGSVSNPLTRDKRASYAVITADEHGYDLEHRWVAYDVSAFMDALDRSRHPEAAFIRSFWD